MRARADAAILKEIRSLLTEQKTASTAHLSIVVSKTSDAFSQVHGMHMPALDRRQALADLAGLGHFSGRVREVRRAIGVDGRRHRREQAHVLRSYLSSELA